MGNMTGEQAPEHSQSRPRKRWTKKKHRKSDGDVRCPKCGRYFQFAKAVENHAQDMHTPEGQERRRRQQLGLYAVTKTRRNLLQNLLNKGGRMSSHIDRMKQELAELNERLGKLEAFIDTNPIFTTLLDDEKSDMRCQRAYMTWYRAALDRRVKRAEAIYGGKSEVAGRKLSYGMSSDAEAAERNRVPQWPMWCVIFWGFVCGVCNYGDFRV